MNRDFYTVRQFAYKLNVSTWTIYRAIKAGRINTIRVGTSTRSTIRIPHTEIERMGLIEMEKVIENYLKKKNE